MNFREIIEAKREGKELSRETIEGIISAYISGEIKDYQMAAFLMAVFFRGMTPSETVALTTAMWKSGETFARDTREDFWIDKHSTGGVGDKTSLILVPLVTAVANRVLGQERVRIPMVSGRGLGHSGGTLDKLEAVPGFNPSIAVARARELLRENGFFMMGQTETLAPADKLIYALRDVTATVECLPLIISSIMSKKLSENLDGIIFDVKHGSGAFMVSLDKARQLADGLCSVARAHGLKPQALLTRMDEPLGFSVGNALEVEECADYLAGVAREPGLHVVVLELAARMLHLASRGSLSVENAKGECEKELTSQEPMRIWEKMFSAQGGDWRQFAETRRARRDSLMRTVWKAPAMGYISRIEPRAIGRLLNALGGGRETKEDLIDPRVGMELKKKVGDMAQRGETVVEVIHLSPDEERSIDTAFSEAVSISETPVRAVPWVTEVFQ